MCGGYSSKELETIGKINSLKKSEWIGVADELAELEKEEFVLLMSAFAEYREQRRTQKRREALKRLPRRRKKSNL